MARQTDFKLDDTREWKPAKAEALTGDDDVINRARVALAEDRPSDARQILDPWIAENERSGKPQLVQAYLLRGDARTATDDEFLALYDYEVVVNKYPESEEFHTAIEREVDISLTYFNGRKMKQFGLRIWDPEEVAVEIMLRAAERLPGSQLAERATIELADYYFREREIELALDTYDAYLLNFPRGQNRMKAAERRIYCDVAKFKGPRYNAAGLINARQRIHDFSRRYPAEAQRTGLNDALMARLDESMATQMLDVATWYERKGDWPSQRHTLRRLARQFPGTVAGSRAIDILTEKGWLETAAASNLEGTPAESHDAAPAASPASPAESKP
ncbi:MAG TPA: outer membrane protein assembly factor BamD [Phycisphaerales bacterium]|nr:outer membrane protein assembly factor BamD [Phycisphaerales bacterium]